MARYGDKSWTPLIKHSRVGWEPEVLHSRNKAELKV